MTTIKVTRAQVYAARARVDLDKKDGRETEPWVLKLAEVDLHQVRAKHQN